MLPIRWVNNTDHHSTLSNISIDFQGPLYFENREERRFDKQKFLLWYDRREVLLDGDSTTRFLGTGGSTTCRIWSDNNADSATNQSMVPGSHEFLTARVRSGEACTCTINFQAVFYNGHASSTNVNTGLEAGMQFRSKDITGANWSSWNDCRQSDIVSNSVTIYDASNFGADNSETIQSDNATGSNKFLSIFRTKDVMVPNQHADVSPPGSWDFVVGLHP